MSSRKSALLLGATGAVGKKLLAELLAHDEWCKIGEYGRRVTALENLPPGQREGRLEQKVIDFENIETAGLKNGQWDVVFVTLGTTRAQAGSAEMFEKIDREYVVNACRAAKSDNPALQQRLVYLSSSGASATSPFLYPKSKGLTELALARLGYSDTIVFRPGLLRGAERPQRRIGETLLGYLTDALSHVIADLEIWIPVLARSIVNAGRLGSSGLPPEVGASKAGEEGAKFTLLGNKGANILGRI
ncbi:hypothetical protein F5J12DRAFT_782911 [Pisolithus orientalis]|uniref:uncharacterized protein n=1 Tax=Pisolithus orientalis TaxID=936130 RepID=UPI002223F494|nr:uncharacterized protein F5J12DRAFT_782911 [Pisolithus orientalis]KAI6006669.1 hypothetical protein F5J12DRAFT_782911 [Pisolithus orientalis]